MARAIDWARYDALKAQGHSEREIAGALRRALAKRQGPPAPVQKPVQPINTGAEHSVDQDTRWLQTIIEETIARLPRKIRAVVQHECVFLVFAPGGLGKTVHRDHLQEQPWLIILRADMDAADAPGVVAHEIAHAWLGHRAGHVPEEEDAALALVQTWGFTGPGAGWPEDDISEEDP